MKLGVTLHHFVIQTSDVDRGVYETLDLRVARHPSESTRYLLTRVIAYCLACEEGLGFSKGGVSSGDEPALAVRDPVTDEVRVWIDVGVPSAERLHKASKLAERVAVYTSDPAALRREAASRDIHRVEDIEVWCVEPRLLDELEALLDRRNLELGLVRSGGQLYFTIGGTSVSGAIEPLSLAEARR